MSTGAKRKHSNSITSSDYNSSPRSDYNISPKSDYNISPRTSSPTPDENKFIKCFQLIITLPEYKNALLNIKNFLTCSGLSQLADIKIHEMTDKKWILLVPDNDKTMYFCSEVSNGKFTHGILKGLFFDYKFPCNDKYFEEYSSMYHVGKVP